jgi:hypothetical protein
MLTAQPHLHSCALALVVHPSFRPDIKTFAQSANTALPKARAKPKGRSDLNQNLAAAPKNARHAATSTVLLFLVIALTFTPDLKSLRAKRERRSAVAPERSPKGEQPESKSRHRQKSHTQER